MADIARLAAVNRGVIYKQFGSRSGLTRALAARETWRLTDTMERVLGENRASPPDALRATFEVLITASERRLLATLIPSPRDTRSLAARLGGAPLVHGVTPRLAGLILNTWPSIRHRDADLLSDALVRLAVSYHCLPASSRAASSDSLAAVLGSFLDQRLAERGHR